jgi:hypothetical protein
MNPKVLICAMSCILACSFARARTPQSVVEQRCGIDAHLPAQRVFAKVNDDQQWQEYKDVKAVPELAPGFGTLAEMWTGHEKTLLIRTDEPGEDFAAYTEYCFDSGGQLIRLAYELRTAWGWAFRMGGPVSNGTVRAESTGFFDTETNKAIPKPESADDVREALKPSLFLKSNRLPFSRLLSR